MYYITARTYDRNGNYMGETRTAATYTVREAMKKLREWGFQPYHEAVPGTFKACKLPKCWTEILRDGETVNAYILREGVER